VTDLAAWLEAGALAQFLKQSRWVYPLVNAGHILGLALLLGAVVPMDLRLLGLVRRGRVEDAVALLRPFAAAGLALAITCGALLFVTQATDYIVNPWFRWKMALLAAAILNAALHLHLARPGHAHLRLPAALSLALWPTVLIFGRMIAYS